MKKGYLRITYLVSGKNIRYLPSYLQFKRVNVLKFLLVNENSCRLTIDAKDRYIFFAICKNMCYNKKVINYKGILSPFVMAFCKIGAVLGAVAFIVLCYYFNGTVLDISVEGSGSLLRRETLAKVDSLGVKKYSRFSDIDYLELENSILSSNDRISFVSVFKRGNTLVINTELSPSDDKPLSKHDGDLVSSVDGVVEEISVLRGTKLVEVGSQVKKGDALVGAYLTDKEGEVYQSFVVARVKVLQTLKFDYEIGVVNDIEIEKYYALSEFKLDGGEVTKKSHEIKGNKITVTLTIRRIFYGGNS